MSQQQRQEPITKNMTPIEIFCSYAHIDQVYVRQLQTHLTPVLRQYPGMLWSDADISPGSEWEREIQKRLEAAQIILLLISPDFMVSDYCYGNEMVRAMERHDRGEACIIPIIVRPVYWRSAPFAKLQVLPTEGKPISTWDSVDDALFNIVEGVRRAIEKLTSASEKGNTTGTAKPLSLSPSNVSQTRAFSAVEDIPVRSQLPEEFPSIVSLRQLSSSDVAELIHIIDTDDALDRVRQGRIPSAWQIFRPYFAEDRFFVPMIGAAIGFVPGLIAGLIAGAVTGYWGCTFVCSSYVTNWGLVAILFFSFIFVAFGIGVLVRWILYRSYVCVLLPQGVIYRNVMINFFRVTDITILGNPAEGQLRVTSRKFGLNTEEVIALNLSGFKKVATIVSKIINTYEQFKSQYPYLTAEKKVSSGKQNKRKEG